MKSRVVQLLPIVVLTFLPSAFRANEVRASPPSVAVDWGQKIGQLKTTPTVFVDPEPPGTPAHDAVFEALRNLTARYVRYSPMPTPLRKSVAELQPPTKDKTFWDFSLMDAATVPFLTMERGRDPIFSFSSPCAPAWMFESYNPTLYAGRPIFTGTQSADQDSFSSADFKAFESYRQLGALVDPTGKQLADYYARVVSWYVQGGFTDERGIYHRSGHHYSLPWWEVLNEIQADMTPQQYVTIYDAVVSAVRKVSPTTRFEGLALAPMGRLSDVPGPPREPEFFEFFLNPKNHRAGIPLDMIAYHFYALPNLSSTLDDWQYSIFDQADGFLNTVAFIESIRKRLSPSTRVNIDELGIILPNDRVVTNAVKATGKSAAASEIPPIYWNLSAAFYSYLYIELAKQGIDAVTAAELTVGSSKFYPSINLVAPETGIPNARFRVLQLLNESFSLGDQLVSTKLDTVFSGPPDVEVQAFASATTRKILIVNKRNVPMDISVAKVGQISRLEVVDVKTASGPPRTAVVVGPTLTLAPFAVAVLSIASSAHSDREQQRAN
jgi:hypothetical protein